MEYGGWRYNPEFACSQTEFCDGMPLPSDPDWKIEPDTHGCPHWTNPHDYFRGGTRSVTTSYCGAYQPANDVDASDPSDANVDGD